MASGIVAPMVQGDDGSWQLQTQTVTSDSLTTKTKNNNVIDSDMFLTLLVAEMQNQDPLEPTSNTEWVSQYATFTQVQQMTEMSRSMDQIRANSLVGKEVIMKVTSESTGEVTYKRGKVEYVQVENGKSLLVIDGGQYSIDDLDSVISDEYSEAYDQYSTWIAKLHALPSLQFIDETYENTLKELFDDFYAMTDYQQQYMQTYAADELAMFSEYLHALELYGIKFEEPDPDSNKSATLDDLLEDFNSKTDDILDKLNSLAGASGSGNVEESDDTEDTDADEDTDTDTDTKEV